MLFAETVERVLQQFGESGAALATSDEAVVRQYEGYQWRFRTEGTANISLLNLLINAKQAMPGGGQIVLRTRTAGNRAVLQIIDTGCGSSVRSAGSG